MKRLHEFYGYQSLSAMPQDIDASSDDISKLSKMKWNNIKMLDPDGDNIGSSNIFTMNFDLGKLNHLLPGIVVSIEQDSRTELNQPHIQLHKDLKRQGLATKLYRLILQEFGHVVSKQSKRLSDKEIKGLYKKLSKDSKIDMFEKNGNILLLHKDNPLYDATKDVFTTVS
tara:strand:- start:209 stop:718 length:510 start_codon:yes stop_codon:yes gene_type:complete